jgi:hypothetical protein
MLNIVAGLECAVGDGRNIAGVILERNIVGVLCAIALLSPIRPGSTILLRSLSRALVVLLDPRRVGGGCLLCGRHVAECEMKELRR